MPSFKGPSALHIRTSAYAAVVRPLPLRASGAHAAHPRNSTTTLLQPAVAPRGGCSALLPMTLALAGACIDERAHLGFSNWRSACRAAGLPLSSLLSFTLELLPTAVLGALVGGIAVQISGMCPAPPAQRGCRLARGPRRLRPRHGGGPAAMRVDSSGPAVARRRSPADRPGCHGGLPAAADAAHHAPHQGPRVPRACQVRSKAYIGALRRNRKFRRSSINADVRMNATVAAEPVPAVEPAVSPTATTTRSCGSSP